MPSRTHFLAMTPHDWKVQVESWGLPSFRAEQIRGWIYEKRVRDPSAMQNLPAVLREKLASEIDWSLPEVTDVVESPDRTTTKLLLRIDTEPPLIMETVIMRYEGRTSLCVSSQVGCKLACSFCQTGKLGFFRNLKAEQILSQLWLSNERIATEGLSVSHVVFMGMGEPFDNYDAAVFAANAMMDKARFGLSKRHVTLSTSGIAPRIEQLASDCEAALAVSLHAADDETRTSLMPINRRYDLETLKKALVYYQKATGRMVTIEYILIREVNDTLIHAKRLVKFLHGLRSKVNLIPFNPHPGLDYERPEAERIRAFQSHLAARSIPAPVRYSKGQDISAACGQLAAKRQGELTAVPKRRTLLEASSSTLP